MPASMRPEPLPWTDLRGLAGVLLNATPETRRAAAMRLLEIEDRVWLPMLVETIQSTEDWRLRARCLEMLGLVAGASDEHTAGHILTTLLALPPAQ
jgi:hypothetical protein